MATQRFVEIPKKAKKKKEAPAQEDTPEQKMKNVAIAHGLAMANLGNGPQEISVLNGRISALNKQIADLKKEPQKPTSKDSTSKELAAIEKDMAKKQKRLDAADEKVKELVASLNTAKAELRTTKKNEESLQNRCDVLTASEKKLQDTNTELTAHVKSLSARDASRANHKESNAAVEALSGEVSSLSEALGIANTENAGLNARIAALESDLKRAAVEYETPAPKETQEPETGELRIRWYEKTCLYSKAFGARKYVMLTNSKFNKILLKPSDRGIDCSNNILDLPGLEQICRFTGEQMLKAIYTEDGESIEIQIGV
ncbi:MAG: hypothetical protein LBS92_01940 [Candidatus Methanoplasma sp.]|jgi:chromosome segregation ATPase|nr:hypothetical protein [Candidatus Methanoplasma sp.]